MKSIFLAYLASFALISFAEAQSPKKYRISFKVSQNPPNSFEEFKFYINNDLQREAKMSPKTHRIEDFQNPILLTFVSEGEPFRKFFIALPAPDKIESQQIITQSLENLDTTATITMSSGTSSANVATVIYSIELISHSPLP